MKRLGTRLLETERLILRRITLNDYKDMYDKWAGREECSRFFPWSVVTDIGVYKERVSSWIDNYKDELYFNWIIELKETKEVVGIINLHEVDEMNQSAETSYILSPQYWGKGIMTEALIRVLKYAFGELEMNRIQADVFQGNDASNKVLEKCGLQREGIAREKYYKDGKYIDSIQYAILYRDWKFSTERVLCNILNLKREKKNEN